MHAIKLYLIGALIVTFLAGLATGVAMGPFRAPVAEEPRAGRRGPGENLADELKLSDEQRKQMREIWRKAFENVPPPPRDKMRELDEQREASVDALLTGEQRERVAKIEGECDRKKSELNAASMAAMKQAQQETRAILTPEQQVKFDQLMAERTRRSRRGGPPGEPPPPATMPGKPTP